MRTLPTRSLAVATAGLAALAVLVLAAAAPAATGRAAAAAAHKCLVMTGSGDVAFIKNFNPYTATGLPNGFASPSDWASFLH